VQAARIAVQILDSHQRDPAFRRVEMFVHCHCSWAVSFIAALGFEAQMPHGQMGSARPRRVVVRAHQGGGMSAIISAFGDAYAGEAQANAYEANADSRRSAGHAAAQYRHHQGAGAGHGEPAPARGDPRRLWRRRRGATGGSPLEVMSDQATHGELARQPQLWQGVASSSPATSRLRPIVPRARRRAPRVISAPLALVSGAEKSAMAAGAA
jgi:hypothetical protein